MALISESYYLVFVLVMPLCLVTKVNTLTAFNCDIDGHSDVYTPSTELSCLNELSNPINEIESPMTLLQMPQYLQLASVTCQLEKKIAPVYCSWLREPIQKLEAQTGEQFFSTPIDPVACKHLLAGRSIKIDGVDVELSPGQSKIILTSPQISPDGFCYSSQIETTATWWRISLFRDFVKAELSPLGEIETIKSSYGLNLASFDSEVYLAPNHFIHLFSIPPADTCLLEKIIKENGTIITTAGKDNLLIIPSLTTGITLTTNTTLCQVTLRKTTDPYLYVSFTQDFPTRSQIGKGMANIPSLIRASVEYAVYSSTVGLWTIKEASLRNMCYLEASLRREILNSAATDPETLGYRLTGELGWKVTKSGEALRLTKCQETNVKISPQATCYSWIPVLHIETNQTLFMHPVHRALSSTAAKIDCRDPSLPVFKMHNKWYELSPHLRALGILPTLPSNLTKTVLDISVSSQLLYSDDVLHQLVQPVHLETRRRELELNLLNSNPVSNNDAQAKKQTESSPYLHFPTLEIIIVILIIWNSLLTWKLMKNKRPGCTNSPTTNICINEPEPVSKAEWITIKTKPVKSSQPLLGNNSNL
ncbi:MAG: hypothetical protein [brine shrimp artovirus 1]|nr:MAG: hypothetical protein [brine shrimp artovirus 1]